MSFDARLVTVDKYKTYDFETITVAGVAIGLTVSKLQTSPRPKRVHIVIEAAQLRYRGDGTDPTSSVGVRMNPDDQIIVEGIENMTNFKVIRTSNTSSTMQVHYQR